MSDSNIRIEDVLFPVKLEPLYLSPRGRKQRSLFLPDNDEVVYHRIPGYKAVVDVQTNRVFAAVSSDYKLVSNQEAIEIGKECFKVVFDTVSVNAMKLFNIVMPKTRSFCHIDFIHEGISFNVGSNDKWVPFLRITNSYNRMRLLRFDIGFCRWICTNGIISGDISIRFKYQHTRGEISKTTRFEKPFDDIRKIENQFLKQIETLHSYQFSKELMLPLVYRVFNINFNEDDLKKPNRAKRIRLVTDHILTLTDKYFTELGNNGYAALNVLTDYASRPSYNISSAAAVDNLQKKSGTWISTFITEIRKSDFDMNDYLGQYINQTKIILN